MTTDRFVAQETMNMLNHLYEGKEHFFEKTEAALELLHEKAHRDGVDSLTPVELFYLGTVWTEAQAMRLEDRFGHGIGGLAQALADGAQVEEIHLTRDNLHEQPQHALEMALAVMKGSNAPQEIIASVQAELDRRKETDKADAA